MKHVLFVIPPGLGSMVSNHEAASGMGALSPERNPFAYPPHTVAVCAASVGARGWAVSVADGLGQQPGSCAQEVAVSKADVLAILVAEGTAEADFAFLHLLRHAFGGRARPRILLIGPSAGLVASSWVDDQIADAVLLGEPELALPATLERVASGATGLLTSFDMAPNAYLPSGLLSDLDGLPSAAWDAVPWQPYKSVSLLSSRGCDAACAFCAYTLTQGNRFRAQSAERIATEWTNIARRIQPPKLVVRDTVFAYDRTRAVEICERITQQGLSMKWVCESRPEHFDRELIQLMKAASCSQIKIGMESGDPALLVQLGRVADKEQASAYLEQVGRVARWCQEAEVDCRVFVMVGLPGQSSTSVEMTLASLRNIAPSAVIHPSVYRGYSGVALGGMSQPVPSEVLETLRSGNGKSSSSAQLRSGASRALAALKGVLGRSNTASATPLTGAAVPVGPRTQGGLRLQQYLLAGSRVFLTGGTGFVGGYVARALAAAGAQVCALVRPGTPLGSLADLPVDIVYGDLTQPSGWISALNGCRFCFHVAALFTRPDEAEAMYAINARATGVLLAACAQSGVPRFVHTSTVGTVGRSAQVQALPDESTPFQLWEQASHYVRSKRLGELIAQSWNGSGLEVVIVKPTAPVGAGDGSPNRLPTATGRRILATLQGQPSGYPSGGVNHAPVRDIAAGHLLAAERGGAGETYILGHCDGNLDERAFLRLVAGAAKANGLLLPERPGIASKVLSGLALTANPRRAVQELGMPQSEMATAFAESVAWYKKAFAEELSSPWSAANANVA